MDTSITLYGMLLLTLCNTVNTRAIKRQGVFGLCNGWGAGCSMAFPTSSEREEDKNDVVPETEDLRHINTPYFLTSGSNWQPIGKRSDRNLNIIQRSDRNILQGLDKNIDLLETLKLMTKLSELE